MEKTGDRQTLSLSIKVFEDLENSESTVSHFPEMQKTKVRRLCLKFASCAHRDGYFWRTLGWTSV